MAVLGLEVIAQSVLSHPNHWMGSLVSNQLILDDKCKQGQKFEGSAKKTKDPILILFVNEMSYKFPW